MKYEFSHVLSLEKRVLGIYVSWMLTGTWRWIYIHILFLRIGIEWYPKH